MSVSEALKLKKSQYGRSATAANVMNLPNILTFSRIILVPVFVWLLSTPTVMRSLAAACVLVLRL